MTTQIDEKKIQSRLRSLIKRHKVPGAALGILNDGRVTEVAAGVVNLNSGVKATPDTVWQIGSMTKAWTATVVMQLVDEGLVDLDAPIQKYLPEFKVADSDVSANVTMRHLLAHTSGMDGDNFEDFGRGDDCLEKYVASCATLKQTHKLGETMSYCNTGYSVAGRVIEVLTDKLWDQAMKERLFQPLGLTHTSTLPEETLLFSNAVGHISLKPGDPAQVAPVWMLPRICGPMGLINSTVRDCLKFAEIHLNNGRTKEGAQVLSGESVQQMQAPQVEVPDRFSLGSHWGVGWILFDWDGHRLFGHDGNTIGQAAFLRVLPEANVAIAMLTNGGESRELYRKIYSEILTELAGVKVPAWPKMPKKPVQLDLQPYAGTYERLAIRLDLQVEGNLLEGTITSSGPLASLSENPVRNISLTPVTADTFLLTSEGEEGTPLPAVFYDFEDGVPKFLHMGARTHPRVST